MKATTQQIYDLLTGEYFEGLEEKLNTNVAKMGSLEYVRNEFSSSDLIRELPQLVDILLMNISKEDSSYFDSLPFNVRQTLASIIGEINSHLSQLYQGSNTLAQLIDRAEQLKANIINWRLDFKAKKIPLFDAKIKQYNELTTRLNELINELSSTEENQKTYNELIEKIKETESVLLKKEGEAESSLNDVLEKQEQITRSLEQSSILLKDIKAYLEQANQDATIISGVKIKTNEFIEKVDEYIQNMELISVKTEKSVNEFTLKTTEIISRNETQTQEIDNQLGKAVGVSLYKSFDARKTSLNTGLNYWLIALALATVSFIGVSIWIFNGISKIAEEPILFAMKLAVSFPLLFIIGFVSSRYAKERRLIEEYAFKSSVALALKPYADLIENDGSDEKYREFLIKTIENIFEAPTDKVFGGDKKYVKDDKFDLKGVDDLLELLKKAKETLTPKP